MKNIDFLKNSSVDDFEGLSPVEMKSLVYDPFTKQSPVQFKTKITSEVLDKIPFLLLMEAHLKYILENESVKLTSIGNLPRVLLHHLYGLGYIKEEDIEKWGMKLSREKNSVSIQNVNSICNEEGLTTKSNGKLYISKKGRDLLKNRQKLFETIFIAYSSKLNLGYHDHMDNDIIGQVGNLFILGLLLKYGNEERESKFYADKYLKAFPTLINCIENVVILAIDKPENVFESCFTVRVFERFFNWFGIIETRWVGEKYDEVLLVKKTDLLYAIIDAPKFITRK